MTQTTTAATCSSGTLVGGLCTQAPVTGPPPSSNVSVSIAQSAVINSQTVGVDLRTSGPGSITVVNAGTINVFGATALYGIRANALGSGNVSVTNNGQIGTSAVGIFGSTTTGSVTLASTGTIISGAQGMIAQSTTGAIAMANSGTVTAGSGNAALSANSSSGSINIANNIGGVIHSSTNSPADLVIQATQTIPGSIVVTNAGTLTGTIQLQGSSGQTIFTNSNSGVWTTGGTSIVAGTFNNQGSVNFAIPAGGSQLIINGPYAGGGQFYMNIYPQNKADNVTIKGSSISGVTVVNVANQGPIAPFTISPILISAPNVSPAAVSNAFTIGTLSNFGNTQVALAQQPNSAGLALALVTASNFPTPVIITAAQSIGFQSSDVVMDRMGELRRNKNNPSGPIALGYDGALGYAKMPVKADPIGPTLKQPEIGPTIRPAAWIKGFGDYQQQNNAIFSYNFGGATFSNDLSYHQTIGGGLVGGDLLINRFTSANDALIVGVMGGYISSNIDLQATPTNLRFSGGTFGVYATYLNGPWFVDTMAKLDMLALTINAPGVAQSDDGKNVDLAANVGYKFDLPNRWYVEPTGGIEYVRTTFDQPNLAVPGAVPLADGDAVRLRGGARVGTDWVSNGVRVEPSVAGFLYDNVKVSNGALFTGTGGGSGLSLPTDQGKVREEIQVAVNAFDLKSGLSGFLRVDTRFGEDLFGIGGRGGLRYQW